MRLGHGPLLRLLAEGILSRAICPFWAPVETLAASVEEDTLPILILRDNLKVLGLYNI